MGFPSLVVAVILAVAMCVQQRKYFYVHAVYIVNLLINNWQLTKQLGPLSIYEIY